MSMTSNAILARLIKQTATGTPPSQDELIGLGIQLSRERGEPTDLLSDYLKPPTAAALAVGLIGSCTYSGAKKETSDEEAQVVLSTIRRLMLDHKIVALSFTLDPWDDKQTYTTRGSTAK